jgi:hypothetical protein
MSGDMSWAEFYLDIILRAVLLYRIFNAGELP